MTKSKDALTEYRELANKLIKALNQNHTLEPELKADLLEAIFALDDLTLTMERIRVAAYSIGYV